MSHPTERGIFSDIDTSELDCNYENIDDIQLPSEVMQLIETADIYKYFEEMENSAMGNAAPEPQSNNPINVINGVPERKTVIVNPFFPYDNIPEHWKWSEYDECMQELRNENLAKAMKNIRHRKRIDTDIKELAEIVIALQKEKIKMLQEEDKENKDINLMNERRKLSLANLKLKSTSEERNYYENLSRDLNEKILAMDQEKEEKLKQIKSNTVIIKIWKDFCNEKEKTIGNQRAQIRELNKTNNELRSEIHKLNSLLNK